MASQIEAAETDHSQGTGRPDPQVQARRRELDGLELSRTRVLRDLAVATHPRHREVLEAALKHLEEKIAGLK
ncbi:MAG TPA: hypothetical protein VG206_28065 [Terriglobia bacterium]|nr:hypothetical protein [Terriglobia bacterium]